MAHNTCTTCGCKKCGCSDNALTTPPACPTPAGCPTPLTCSEVFNAECVVYTGVDIECLDDVVVATDTNLADALEDIINFFCAYVAAASSGSVVEVCDTNDYLDVTSNTDPITGVVTYTLCFDPTNLPEVVLSGGTGINVTSNVVGNITTYTVLNTDLGSSQNIFKNIAVSGQNTVIADSNNDTLTLTAGSGISITTNDITDTITITNTSPGSAVTLTDAGTGVHQSLVNDGIGPTLATKGLKAGAGISFTSTATDITITGIGAKNDGQGITLGAIGTSLTVGHTLATPFVVISITQPTGGNYPLVALVHGIDYSYSVLSASSIEITTLSAAAVGSAQLTIIG